MAVDVDRLNLLLTLGRYAEGEKAAREAIAANPEWGAGYGFLALFLSNQGHHLPAIRAARDCVGKDPHDPWSHAVRASVLNRLGRTDQALVAADEAIRLDPTYVFAYRVRCEVLCAELRYRQARTTAIDGLKYHPTDEMLLHWKGWAEYRTDRLDAAIRTAEDGLMYHPDSASLRNVLGCALMDAASGRGPVGRIRTHNRAEEAFREAVRLQPGEPAYQDNRRNNALRCRAYALWWLLPVAGVIAAGLTLAPAAVTRAEADQGLVVVVFMFGALVALFAFSQLASCDPEFVLAAPIGRLGLPTVPLTPAKRRVGRWSWVLTLAGLIGTPAVVWLMALAVRL